LAFVKGGPDEATKEHYIPQWLFNRHGLRQQTMDLPSKSEIAYGHFGCHAAPLATAGSTRRSRSGRRVLITSVPPPWAEEDREIIKRWLAKVYLGVRVRASMLPVDQKDPASPTIADPREIDEAVLLRMVVGGRVTVPHSSLFIYKCDPDAGDGFDFFSSDQANVVTLRSGSVGLACLLLDGEEVENGGILPAHPLVAARSAGPLDAPSFRIVAAYALATAAAADVCHDVAYVIGADGQHEPFLVRFTPHWTDGPTPAQVQALAAAMADRIGVDVEWV
jgi:hypothetical protein